MHGNKTLFPTDIRRKKNANIHKKQRKTRNETSFDDFTTIVSPLFVYHSTVS